MKKNLNNFLLLLALSCSPIYSIAKSMPKIPLECGALKNAYGPFDFTNPIHVKKQWPIVAQHHFTPSVEYLKKGKEGRLHQDLDYTLRAFPNQHRALYSVIKYETLNKKPPLIRSAKCYLIRATAFQPKDDLSWMLFGIYYHRLGKFDRSLDMYKIALKLNPDNEQLHYNMGLLYLKMNKNDLALKHAKIAYKKGAKQPGLKNKLIKLNIWK